MSGSPAWDAARCSRVAQAGDTPQPECANPQADGLCVAHNSEKQHRHARRHGPERNSAHPEIEDPAKPNIQQQKRRLVAAPHQLRIVAVRPPHQPLLRLDGLCLECRSCVLLLPNVLLEQWRLRVHVRLEVSIPLNMRL